MKKLLSILATVGLVATTGTTVVACGNGKGDKAAKGAFDLQGEHNVIAGQSIEIKIAEYDKIKEKYSKFDIKSEGRDGVIRKSFLDEDTGDFTVIGLMKGEATIKIEATLKEEPGSDEPPVKEISSEFKITVEVANFLEIEIKVPNLVAGQKLVDVKLAIKKAIDEQVVDWTVIDQDWTVSGDAIDGDVVKEGTIIVTANVNSNYVKGSFEVKVEKN